MVIALYKQFGQGEDYAKAMVKQWQEDLARPKGLDPKITLSHAAQVGYFTRAEDAAILALEQEKVQKQEDDEWMPEDEARLKAAKDRRKAAAENAQSLLLANLDIWKNDQQYNGGKEKKELTELEIANRLWDTIANYTPGNRDQVEKDGYRRQESVNITAASDNYMRTQSRNIDLQKDISSTNRLNEEERRAAEKMLADMRQLEKEACQRTQPVDSIVPVSRNKDLPAQWGDDGQEAVLYVPEGWYAEGITVGVTTPGRRYAEAKIVSKPDCTSPTMSKALRRQLGTMNINYDQITVTASGSSSAMKPAVTNRAIFPSTDSQPETAEERMKSPESTTAATRRNTPNWKPSSKRANTRRRNRKPNDTSCNIPSPSETSCKPQASLPPA